MAKVDLVVKNGRIVSPAGIVDAGIAVDKGRIAALARDANLPEAKEIIDAKGKHVIPGVIDPHTHIGGKFLLERDFRTETPGAAAGGVTTIGILHGAGRANRVYKEFVPPEDEVSWHQAFPIAREIGEENSLVDFFYSPYIHTEEQANEILEYATKFGLTSFKFYANLKQPSTTHVSPLWRQRIGIPVPFDDGVIYLGFENIGKLGPSGLAMVHCENTEVATVLMKRLKAQGRTDPPAWEERSPGWLEAEHVRRYAYFAKVANCRFYVIHLSSAEGLAECLKARAEGVRIVVETCPQYLTRTKFDEPGVRLKVNPPIRSKEDNEVLWKGVREGWIDCMGTDHVVTNKHEKLEKGDTSDHLTDPALDIWSTGSGFPGLDTLLPIMLSEGVNKGRISFERLVEVCCQKPAQIFGLYPKKGSISVGSDADLVIVDMEKEVKVTPEILHAYADFTIFEGMKLTGWPVMTILRGKVIAANGQVLGKPGYGQYLPRKPGHVLYPLQ